MAEFWDNIKSVFSLFEITDILDIAIVSFLIYQFILFIKNSRAQLLVKGSLIILVAYMFARLLHMNMLAYIVEIIIRNGVIAMLIIFQPELRSVIERVGRSRFSMKSLLGIEKEDEKRAADLAAISGVVEGFRFLQKERMGALVVFEREVKLDEIARTGTVVDASVSTRMLSNLFFNKAPLHDGAVIIREGRIHAAGCILPLTQGITPRADYGTRHRAAIGMSESSDAVVAVLSEENGLMSVVENGEILRYSNIAEFTSALMNVLIPEDDEDDNGSAGKAFDSVKSIFSKNSNKNIKRKKAEDDIELLSADDNSHKNRKRVNR